MLRNEYGAIQQHLEPEHIRDILVPLPDDKAKITTLAEAMRKANGARESLETFHEEALREMSVVVAAALSQK